MKSLLKVIAMAVVLLAIITMAVTVKAASAVEELQAYARAAHNVNGMVFELNASQKTQVAEYIATLDESTAAAVYADVLSMEQTLKNTGATSTIQVSAEVKSALLSQAKATATKAGLVLSVNTQAQTFTLTKVSDGKTVTSGNYKVLVTTPAGPAAGGSATGSTTSTGSTLLYTGANYAVYAVSVLAIVAVAAVVRKRA